MEYQTVRYEQGSKDGLCTGCCPSEVAPDRCLGGHDVCGEWSDDHSCENQSPVWKTYYLAYTEDNIDLPRRKIPKSGMATCSVWPNGYGTIKCLW